MWAYYLRKGLRTLGTNTSNIVETFNGTVKERVNTDMHLTESVCELMIFTEEKYLQYTRRDVLSLRVSKQSWKLGREFVELHEKLSNKAIIEIREQKKLVEANNYEFVELAGNYRTFTVNKQGEARRHSLVQSDINDKFKCDCEYSKFNALPCRHVLFIIDHFKLPIYESFNFLPRWLKATSFVNEDSNSNDSVISTQSVASTNTVKRR